MYCDHSHFAVFAPFAFTDWTFNLNRFHIGPEILASSASASSAKQSLPNCRRYSQLFFSSGVTC